MMHGQQVENLWRGGMQAGSDSKLVKNLAPLSHWNVVCTRRVFSGHRDGGGHWTVVLPT